MDESQLPSIVSPKADVALSVSNQRDKSPEQIHISITNDPQVMVVMWVTKGATEPIVKYWTPAGPQSDESDADCTDSESQQHTSDGPTLKHGLLLETGTSQFVEVGAWSGFCHTVKLKDLKAGAIYEYQVGDASTGKFSDEYSFKTRPFGKYPFTMVTFADFDTVNEIVKKKTVMSRLLANMSEFDLILEYGDLSYADGNPDIWDTFFNHIQPIAACKPWMVTVGNHENELESGFTLFNSRFRMPGKNNYWYSFNYGYAHFIIVSTEHSLEPSSPQYEWIIKDLDRAQSRRQDYPWIIASGHRALYGSNKRWFHKDKAKLLRNALTPIFDKYHVNLALFGHCHAYERTHPIYAGEVDPRGTVYLLAGVAGAELDKEWWPQPQWSAYRTAHHGYGVLHVKNQKKLRFCYHRERDGKMWDAFTLKNRNGVKTEIRYDYENKFLRNWINVPVSVERQRLSEDRRKETPFLGLTKLSVESRSRPTSSLSLEIPGFDNEIPPPPQLFNDQLPPHLLSSESKATTLNEQSSESAMH